MPIRLGILMRTIPIEAMLQTIEVSVKAPMKNAITYTTLNGMIARGPNKKEEGIPVKLTPEEKTDLKLNVVGKIPEILLDS